jgi:hypothetical protein
MKQLIIKGSDTRVENLEKELRLRVKKDGLEMSLEDEKQKPKTKSKKKA